MNKKFKKICSMALTLAITATSVVTAASGMSMSASALGLHTFDIKSFSDVNVIDD